MLARPGASASGLWKCGLRPHVSRASAPLAQPSGSTRSCRKLLMATAVAAATLKTWDVRRCAAESRSCRRVLPLTTREVEPASAGADRPTVVLVHGLDSWSGTWQGLMEELARRGIRTLAVDLRGHGESPLGEPEDFSPEQLAADVRGALQAAGLLEGKDAKVALVGHSMGGRIALQYAADYPQDLSILVIEDMECVPREYPELQGEELQKRQTFSRSFPSWERAKEELMSFGYDAGRVEGWYTSATPRVYPRPGHGVWSCINPHAQYLAKRTVLNSMRGQESLQRIAALQQSGLADFPVHVCVAGASGTVCYWDKLPGGLHDMASVLPTLQLHKFPAADHSIHNSDLQKFADFLEKPEDSQ